MYKIQTVPPLFTALPGTMSYVIQRLPSSHSRFVDRSPLLPLFPINQSSHLAIYGAHRQGVLDLEQQGPICWGCVFVISALAHIPTEQTDQGIHSRGNKALSTVFMYKQLTPLKPQSHSY